jgi:molybdenum cofactor cytidylyltransferase
VKFGPVALAHARGCVLAHSQKLPEGTLKKGKVLDDDDLHRLAAAGVQSVIVATLESDDVAENDAAGMVAAALAGSMVEVGAAVTGRVNLHARAAGLFMLDAARVHAANSVHEGVTIATLHADTPVSDGQMLATVKIIPYAVPASALQRVVQVLSGDGAALRVAPWQGVRVGLVLTRAADTADSVLSKMRRAVAARLEPLGAALVAEHVIAHDATSIARALKQLAHATDVPGLLLISGIAATVDREDVVPAGVVMAGGTVLHAGMPVDPGNLLVLAQLDDALPIVGMPTCARSPKLNGFDFVLRRFAAGESVTSADIQAMGVGGLLTEIESRPMPRDAGARPVGHEDT